MKKALVYFCIFLLLSQLPLAASADEKKIVVDEKVKENRVLKFTVFDGSAGTSVKLFRCLNDGSGKKDCGKTMFTKTKKGKNEYKYTFPFSGKYTVEIRVYYKSGTVIKKIRALIVP